MSVDGDDHFHDECGIVGIFGGQEASTLAYLGLHALQHRGQESAGIVTQDGDASYAHREMGLVNDIFKQPVLETLPGKIAIGHVRYSTTGSSLLKNAQPFAVEYARGPLAVAHNGNLVNAQTIRNELEAAGSIFQSTMDTEVIAHLIAKAEGGPVERIIAALARLQGSYSLVFVTEGKLIAARDPRGWRPLILGRKGDTVVLASETCALDLIEADYIREIEPGEVLVVDENGLKSHHPFPKKPFAHCVFEYIYFARPDSHLYGADCYPIRLAFGDKLAEESPAEADVVLPIPDSGNAAAFGYARRIGLPLEWGMIRSHYTGRTFIEPSQQIRHFGVRLKLNPNRAAIAGRRVIVVDDSIVRGTTMKKIIAMIRNAGALEIHVRISSPPVMWPCHYGIDTPNRDELIAAGMTVEAIRDFIGSDSLAYLSMDGLKSCLPQGADRFCFACFNGQYPDPPETEVPKRQLALFETRSFRIDK